MKTGCPSDEILAAYASGAAREGVALATAAHLTYCADCRSKVATYEVLAGALLAETEVEAAPDVEDLMDRLDEPVNKYVPPLAGPLPSPVAQAVGMNFDQIPWRFRLPGVHEYVFSNADGDEISLLKVRPGAAVPSHTHEGEELTVIFEGELEDDGIVYKKGDISVADASVDHNPRAGGDTTCICLAVLSGGVKFTGPIGRALNLFS